MNKKLTALGFKEANISSIAKIKKHIPFVEKELLNNISGLKKLLKIGFRPANISSILHGSRAKCGYSIKTL